MSAFNTAFAPAFRSAWASIWGLGSTLASAVRALFSQGQQGAWYDLSDMSTLYQDAAGATPVTTIEQPVGLMRDKSGRNNHASQATAASRPVLSARVNLLTSSEDFASASWNKLASATITGTKQINLAAVANSRVESSGIASTVGAVWTAGLTVSGTGSLLLAIVDLGGSFPVTSTSVNLTATPTRYTVTRTHTDAAATNVLFRITNVANAAATVIVDAPQFETGTTATRYQRVNTATDYDSIGFPMYGKSDGVDDSMSSATGGGGTAGFFFCQAIKSTGGAGAVRTLLSDSGTNSGYRVQLNASNQLSFSAGNGTAYTTIATAAATVVGTTHLLTAWDDGTNLNVQLDSGTVATIARPVVTAGTAGFTLGKDNGAATGFFNGNLYPEVYRQGGGLTAAERAQVQAYVRSKAGI